MWYLHIIASRERVSAMPEQLHPIFDSKLMDLAISVFDLETTGLYAHKDAIIQVAVVNVEAGEIDAEWMDYVNPGQSHRPISEFITGFTGILDSQLTTAPTLVQAMQKFDEFVGTRIVAGHNISNFDLNFIRRAEVKTGVEVQSVYYIDTLKLMRSLHPELPSKKLLDCGRFYEIDFNEEELHNALADTRLGASVMLKQFEELANQGIFTFSDMLGFIR